ncbi:ABC transporter ATP-binding protein [Knoellia sp. CPCC 206435]|uniref:ABC transporter ATP-binding protein n=1 Tax=Knoellia terrae TaxID=3404797 RepID=UPI003B434138
MGRHSERGGRTSGARADDEPGAARIVDVHDVSVSYGDVAALRGVSFSAAPGDFVAVTGHSGAGKTTLVNAIAGIVGLASGAIDLGAGRDRSRDPAAVAIIPQGNGLASVLTAYENVLAPLRARGCSPAEAAERATAALASVGLGESGTHLVEELSGGQQQRAAVARGLAIDAGVLLADEPTSELDHDNRERILDLLRARADAGGIVVMTTHDPEAAERADRVIVLDDGLVV